MAMSQVSSAFCHAASSSHQMNSCCGPRRRAGFSDVKPRIDVPLFSSSTRSELLYRFISASGMTDSSPLSPSKHVCLTSA